MTSSKNNPLGVPLFTRAHYEVIAAELAEAKKLALGLNPTLNARLVINELTYSLSLRFREDNPRFNQERFLTVADYYS